MPTTARPTKRTGEGPEPFSTINPDPPRRPGSGTDVDPHVRVENVAPMVPAVALEGAPPVPGPEAVAGAPLSLEQFVILDSAPPDPSTVARLGTYVGYTPPPVIRTEQLIEWEPGGQRYLVICRPWVNAVVDGRFVTARTGDVVVLTEATARRYLDTGALLPEPASE